MPYYEDYLDTTLFYHVKRGRQMEKLSTVYYKTDTYSVEGRNN
jgi:hypothetical protein